MAYNAQGSIIYWSTTTSLSTSISIGGVIGFNGPTGSAPVIDGTHLLSTAKEKAMGLRDEGQITLDCFLVTTDNGQTKIRECRANRTEGHWAIKLASPTTVVYQLDGCGFVTGFAVTGAVDQMVKLTATIECSGAVSMTTVAAP